MPGAYSLAATCEDYNSDDSEVVGGTRFQANVAGQANVAAKRSHSSVLGNAKPVEVVGPDAASDSGYSSHTTATMSSADSAQSQKSSSASAMADPPPAPSPKRRPAALVDHRRISSQSSPRKPLAKSGSVSRRPREREEPECTVPNCQCGKSQNRRPPTLSPLDSGLELNIPSFDQRSDRPSYSPPSPMSARQPPSYIQGSAVIQPAVSARRRSSSSSRARPVSYHAGVTPDTNYWAPGMQFPIEHGPPLSMSAHFNQPMPSQHLQPFSPMGATPPTGPGFYPPGHPLQTTLPYDTQRPHLQQRTSSQYNTRRPASTYVGRPLISYDQQAQQNSLVSARAAPSARYSDEPTQSSFDGSSSSEFDDDYDDDTDRALMPPPPKSKPVPERRPSIRHANTTSSYNARMTQSQTLPERNRERDYEPRFARSAAPTTNNSRTSSVRRPSISGAVKADSYSNSNGNPKVTVENATSRRRQSYMGHEQRIELEAKHRDSEAYKDTAQPQSRRRQTDLDPRRRDADVLETKKREVEAYQQRSRGDTGPQLTESVLKAARRSSRIISGGSDVGSMHSKASSHDRSSRISQASQSNHTTLTNSGNGEIKMRIDASTAVNLEIVGDMEGRTIRLNPDGDTGYAELVIGAARGKETAYPNERSSTADKSSLTGRRLMPRREAEEASVRSRRSSRSGREERDRQPLARRRRADE